MTSEIVQHPGVAEGERAVTAIDPLVDVKKSVLVPIEQIKAGPDPVRNLHRFHERATKSWGTVVNQIRRANGMVDDLRASVGIERKNDDARESPNWVIDQIRKAIREVEA